MSRIYIVNDLLCDIQRVSEVAGFWLEMQVWCEVSSIPDPNFQVVGEVGQGWRNCRELAIVLVIRPKAKANECAASSDRDAQIIIDLS